MALQRINGWWVAAQADLEDQDHEVNIPFERNGGVGKQLGTRVLMGSGVEDTNHIVVFAEGSSKTSEWSQYDGVVTYTPV